MALSGGTGWFDIDAESWAEFVDWLRSLPPLLQGSVRKWANQVSTDHTAAPAELIGVLETDGWPERFEVWEADFEEADGSCEIFTMVNTSRAIISFAHFRQISR